MESKVKSKVRMLTEGGMMIALAILLNQIKIYQAPNGGSVSAGSMIPIMLYAIRWGVGPGIAVGSVYGLLDFILKPYFYHWLQFLLDYPIAFGLLGLAGIGYVLKEEKTSNEYIRLVIGVLLAILGRLISHVLSGVIFFAEYAEGNVWLYSIGYNASYLVPEFIISVIVLGLIWKPLKRAMKS